MSKKTDQTLKTDNSLSRRQFLKGSMAAATVGAAGLALPGCSGNSVLDQEYPEIPDNMVNLPSNGKSVLILGGGFGGMHAACELLDRGFSVTILEKSSMLGGKLKSFRDKTFGVPPANDPDFKGYPRDHGAHAVWGFYNNLREFMGRHGYKLFKFPRESTMYNFLDKDGTQAIMGLKPSSTGFLGKLSRAREMQKAMSTIAKQDLGSMSYFTKIGSFDFNDKKQRMYLDSISFPEWARSVGIPEILINRFFGPTSEMAMFDHIDNTSALYILMLSSIAGGTYDDQCIDIFMHPPGETYVAPIEQYIKARGGNIIYNAPVINVNHNKGRITGVMAGDVTGVSGEKKWKCKICGSVFSSSSKPDRCPVCGAPADQIILISGGPPTEYAADFYIMALDTPGAKEVVAASNLLGDSYFDNIMKLDKTSVYPVNIWYQNCDSWEKRFPGHLDFFASSFKFLGITLNWANDGTVDGKKVSDPLVPDYQNKNIAVIETQIANTEKIENLSDEQIVRLVHEELKIVMPDLPEPYDFYVNRWDTYSPQRVGYEALRPPIQSPIDNLFLIGDWVRTDHESVYMEKTNVASKMVTNLLLDKINQKKGRITILRSGTESIEMKLSKLLFSVYP